MAEKDDDQQTDPLAKDEEINDPLTRRDVEAPRKEFEGTKPE